MKLSLLTRLIIHHWWFFSDGSCFYPKDRLFSIAGSAIVTAHHGSQQNQLLKRCLVPGADHTPHRAEIFGVILALQASYVIHLYCDCQAVISDLQNILQYREKGIRWTPNDHCDLWDIVESLVRDRPSSITCYKTKGHVKIDPNLSEQELWEAVHNHSVDTEAKNAILKDNSILFKSISDLFQQHTAQQALHQTVVECQSKITQKTFQLLKKNNGPQPVDEIVAPENPDLDNTSVWTFPYTIDMCNHSIYNPVFTYRLFTWANSLSWENSPTGETSFLELFLEFSYTTGTLAPCNTLKPPYFELFDQNPTCDSSGFLLSHNYLNFGKAARWLEKRHKTWIFPPERKKHSSALRIFGWRGAMWGVKRKAHLHHRDRINEFIRPMKLFRSKSLEVAFRNPSIQTSLGDVNESSFVSSEQAFKMCFKNHAGPIHAD